MSTRDDAGLLGMLPYTLLTVAVVFFAVVWRSGSIAMLDGLTYYILPETPEERRRAQLAKAGWHSGRGGCQIGTWIYRAVINLLTGVLVIAPGCQPFFVFFYDCKIT
jgi:hypothetical protein